MFNLLKRPVLRIARLLIRLVRGLFRMSSIVVGLGLLLFVLDTLLLRNPQRPD
ncbi:MAG: hypothetical protein ABI305_04095 [Tepidiformaceae bacterium]